MIEYLTPETEGKNFVAVSVFIHQLIDSKISDLIRSHYFLDKNMDRFHTCWPCQTNWIKQEIGMTIIVQFMVSFMYSVRCQLPFFFSNCFIYRVVVRTSLLALTGVSRLTFISQAIFLRPITIRHSLRIYYL